jgi:hypothetical protein
MFSTLLPLSPSAPLKRHLVVHPLSNQERALQLLNELLKQSLSPKLRQLGEETALPALLSIDPTVEFTLVPKPQAKTLLRYALLKTWEVGRLARWWSWLDTVRLNQLQV